LFVVSIPSSAQTIAGGQTHSLALKNDGTVWAWGANGYGQLGDGTNTNNKLPVQVSSLTNIIAVAAGIDHSLALKSDGTVWAWGYNYFGQLGNGTYTNSNTPVQVSSLTNIIAVAAGYQHSLALKSDGTVWTWGNNSSGQLGNGTNISKSNTPVQVSSLTGITAIAGGGSHSLALKSDGTVWAWGANNSGQLGNGNNTNSNTPVQVSSLTGITAIAGGGSHTLALKNDGTVWTWGNNNSGQLGNGNNTNSNTPVQVSSLTGIIAIAAGSSHSLALKNDGTVWAWGYNYFGQLGNGNNTNRNTPVQVSSLTGIIAVAAGVDHSLALKNDGTVWAWGINNNGELGNGSNISSSNVPVQTSITNVLPVELTSFSASVSNGNVLLSWQTATEVNNYGFEIERSIAQISNLFNNWEKIGFVQGHGNSNSPKDYSFVDANPPSGKLQYRLKQIDTDGSFEYSQVVEVENELPKQFSLEQNYPNPFNPTTTIKYSIPMSSFDYAQDDKSSVMVSSSNHDNADVIPNLSRDEVHITLKIYDILGREVATLVDEYQKPGTYNYQFSIGSYELSSGIYFYQLQVGDFIQTKKMLIMK